jgi:uncharacterized protein (TIGR00369 family)
MTYVHDPSVGRGVARFVGIDLREVGDFASGEIVLEGDTVVRDHLRDEDGHLRAGALLTMCDNVGGFCGGLAALPDGWVVSTNLMLRASARATSAAHLHFRSTVLRRGRNAIVTDVDVRDETGARVALGTLTSAVLVPEAGPPHWPRPAAMEHAHAADDAPDYYEWLGLRAIDELHSQAGASAIELGVFDELRNPWGIVHGGVTAALIDAAASRVVPGSRTRDAVVHYLAPNRVGPVRASATPLGERPDGTVVRVEVRDHGARERATALAVVTVS